MVSKHYQFRKTNSITSFRIYTICFENIVSTDQKYDKYVNNVHVCILPASDQGTAMANITKTNFDKVTFPDVPEAALKRMDPIQAKLFREYKKTWGETKIKLHGYIRDLAISIKFVL